MKHLLLIITLATLVCPFYAQETKSITAHRIHSSDIILDGRLDEQFWSEITESDGFLMQEPVEGGSPTERTVVKIAYDQSNLFIGVVLYDSSPSEIKAFQKRRDAELDTDDIFRWILDTYLDGRNAYYFEINPAGLIGDGLVTTGQGTSVDKSWDGIWRPWTYVGDLAGQWKLGFRFGH